MAVEIMKINLTPLKSYKMNRKSGQVRAKLVKFILSVRYKIKRNKTTGGIRNFC